MKKFFLGFIAIFVLGIGAVAAALLFIPASTYGRVAEENLEAMLGRDVTLASDPSITFFPRLGATIENVQIANAEGYDEPYFASAESLSIAVKWLPLFSRRVEIAALRFDGGEILLHQKSDTDNNWTFSPTEAEVAEETEDDDSQGQASGFDAIIPRAELTNMRVRYTNDATGETYDANPINLTARLDGLNAPATVSGDITLNGIRFDLTSSVSSIQAIGEAENFELSADISSDLVNLGYEGSAQLSDAPSLNGSFSVSTNNLGDIMNMANLDQTQDLSTLGQISASGRVSGSMDALFLSDLSVSQEARDLQTAFEGTVSLNQNVPIISGQLTSRSSNLRRFLTSFGIELPEMRNGALQSLNADIQLSTEDNSTNVEIQELALDDIDVSGTLSLDLTSQTPRINATLAIPEFSVEPYLSEAPSRTNEAPATGGWSEDHIDLSFLHATNGAIRIDIGELTDGRARVLDVVVDGQLSNGRFTGSFDSIPPEGGRPGRPSEIDPFYSGRLDTDITLVSRADGANSLNLRANGSGITAAALVRFFTGQNVLQGIAALDANIQMSGRSVADFVRSMSGTYDAEVVEGAILGINLPQLLRSAQTFMETRTLPDALSPQAETDFSSLQLNGQIESGVAEITTFQLIAPFLRATAEGEINLYDQTMDLHIYPRALTSATGDTEGVNGYGIPLALSGSWTSPQGSLDTEFLTDLAANAVRNRIADEAQSRIGHDAIGSILGDALGVNRGNQTTRPDDSAEQTTDEIDDEPQEEPDVEDAARSLLRDIITRPRD